MTRRPLLLPNRLTSANLRGDFFGGLTAGIVALPLALGFGVASGAPDGATAGLYGAIFVGILAALWGGTPAQVSGPTGPLTVVVAGLLASHAIRPELMFSTIALAGLLQIGMGFSGLGQLIRFIPQPVISGFMTGIGIIIILLQLQPILGLPSATSPLIALTALPADVQRVNGSALLLGLGTIVVVYVWPRLVRLVPGELASLVLLSAVAAWSRLEVPVIGSIPRGLPTLHVALPSLEELHLMVFPALTIAALASIDSLLTSVVADNLTHTQHDSDRELVGQGLGNTVAGLFGGLPGAGATMRTVVNIRTGGRTPLSGAFHGLLLLAVLMGLGPLAERIPLAVLAGILITVGIGIIDYRGLWQLPRAPRADAAVMVLVLGLTVFADLMTAVGVGVVLACLLFVQRMSTLGLGRYVPIDELEEEWRDERDMSEAVRRRVQVFHFEGPFFFATAQGVRSILASLDEDTRAVIIRMDRVPFIDLSAAHALENLARSATAAGAHVLVVGLREGPRALLARLHVIPDRIPESHVFGPFSEALAYAVKHYASEHAGD